MAIALFIMTTGTAHSAGKTIVIMPWKYNGPPGSSYIAGAMNDMFFSRLASVEGLSAVKGSKQVSTTDGAIKALGKTKADYIFFGSLSSLGQNISLDGHLVWVKGKSSVPFSISGRGVDSLVGMADNLTNDISSAIRGTATSLPGGAGGVAEPTYSGQFNNKIEIVDVSKKEETKTPEAGTQVVTPISPAEITPVPTPAPKQVQKSSGFAVRAKSGGGGVRKDFIFKSQLQKDFIKSILTADLNGDGIKEIITISERKIYIDNYTDGKLKRVAEIKGPKGTNHITLSAIGTQNSTAGAVFIASLLKGKASSKVLTYEGGEYKITAQGIRYITRVLTLAGKLTLVGQEYKHGQGLLNKYHILGDNFEPIGKLDLPKGINILGLQIADFTGDGSEDIAALDSSDHIKLFEKIEAGSDGLTETWQSSTKFGGSLDRVDYVKSAGSLKSADSQLFSSGFKAYDSDGDGILEIISRANIAGGFFGQYSKIKRRYTSGTVKSMVFDGAQMTDNWETKVMQGYIADFVVVDIDQDGRKDILLVVVPKGKPGRKAKSHIIAYRLF